MGKNPLRKGCARVRSLQLVEKVFFEYFLGAAHASLSVAKPWSASEVRQLSAWEGALPLPFPRFFEKNRVKLLIFRTFLCHFNASALSGNTFCQNGTFFSHLAGRCEPVSKKQIRSFSFGPGYDIISNRTRCGNRRPGAGKIRLYAGVRKDAAL